jgi:hypothetical protein
VDIDGPRQRSCAVVPHLDRVSVFTIGLGRGGREKANSRERILDAEFVAIYW